MLRTLAGAARPRRASSRAWRVGDDAHARRTAAARPARAARHRGRRGATRPWRQARAAPSVDACDAGELAGLAGDGAARVAIAAGVLTARCGRSTRAD